MKLRTDDDIHRARLVYLGPPGYTFPFHFQYAQYGLFAALAGITLVLFVGLTGSWMAFGFSLAVALFMTGWIWSQVDPDRPVLKVIKVLLTDWRSVKTPTGNLPRLTARHIRFTTTDTTGSRR